MKRGRHRSAIKIKEVRQSHAPRPDPSLPVTDWNSKDSRDRFWLAAIFLAALLLRVAVLWQLARNNPGFWLPDVDSGWHYTWAKAIAGGDWIGNGVFYRAPLYPYILGIWIKIFGDGLWPIRLAQAALGGVSACLVALLGWRVFGRRVALPAGFFWAIWGPMIYYETELLIPVLIVPLNLLALWLAVGRYDQPRQRVGLWLGIGLILGLSAIARPNILITIPVFLWLAWKRCPGTPNAPVGHLHRLVLPAVLLGGLVLPIIPVTLHNLVAGHDPVLIAYQGGVNFYLGNNPQADGLTMQMPEVSLDPTLSWDRFVGTTDSIAQAEAGHPLRPSEISAFWTRKALDYIRDHPLLSFRHWTDKAYYLFNGFEVGDQTDIYDYTRYSTILRLLVWHFGIFFPFGLIAPLGLVGMAWSFLRVPRSRFLSVFVALYAFSVIGFLATARHRLPIVPVLLILAVNAAWFLRDTWRARQLGQALSATAVVILLLFILNRPTVAQIMNNPAFTLYQEALVYDRQGNYDKAIKLYGDALNKEPMLLAARRNLALALVHNKQFDLAATVSYSYLQFRKNDGEAINNLGLAYLGLGETSKAMGSFRVAARKNANLAQPHFNLGNIALERGKFPEAAYAFKTSIEADSSFGPGYNALGVLLARAGRTDSAIAILRLCTKKNPEYPSAWANLGGILLENGEAEEGIRSLQKALQLNPESAAVRYNLAAAYVKTGRERDAEPLLREVLKADPVFPGARQLLESINKTRKSPR